MATKSPALIEVPTPNRLSASARIEQNPAIELHTHCKLTAFNAKDFIKTGVELPDEELRSAQMRHGVIQPLRLWPTRP